MINSQRLRAAFLIAASLAASGCSVFHHSAPKTPVLGERIAILNTESDVTVDPATAALPFSLPAPTANADWAQPGGSSNHSVGQLALGANLTNLFTVQAGHGSSIAMRLSAAPIVANGRVYTIDSLGAVRAFDANTGAQYWASQTPDVKGNEDALFGGGLAYDQGKIFATNGLGFVAALDERTGGILWQVRPGGPLRGSPTVAYNAVYVMSQDNQIYSLKESDGTTNWSNAAALEIAGVFGAGSPAVGQGTVVAGFSSGELNAYRYENGRQVWQDALQRTSIQTSVSSLSDVDADPIIDNGQVFALGQGGRMVALEINSGQRQWEINIAGTATPWIAGDWIYAITDSAKLLCIYRQNGHIRWISQLPQFEKPKSKKGQIDYVGPVLAGNRLIFGGSNGALIFVNAQTGDFMTQTKLGAGISQPPIVANSTLYVLDDDGRLHALR